MEEEHPRENPLAQVHLEEWLLSRNSGSNIILPVSLFSLLNKCCISTHMMLLRSVYSEQNMIRIWNNGKGIPVAWHAKESMYVPSLIFGHLLTSSNYDDTEKKVTGRTLQQFFTGILSYSVFPLSGKVELRRTGKSQQIFVGGMGKMAFLLPMYQLYLILMKQL